MIKFIAPAIIILLAILYWEKINKVIYKKFKIRINYLLLSAALLMVFAIYLLVKN